MDYEVVIGCEVHVELKTKTKIFCNCPTDFGGEPNTHVCPVSQHAGLQGSDRLLVLRVGDMVGEMAVRLQILAPRYIRPQRNQDAGGKKTTGAVAGIDDDM